MWICLWNCTVLFDNRGDCLMERLRKEECNIRRWSQVSVALNLDASLHVFKAADLILFEVRFGVLAMIRWNANNCVCAWLHPNSNLFPFTLRMIFLLFKMLDTYRYYLFLEYKKIRKKWCDNNKLWKSTFLCVDICKYL